VHLGLNLKNNLGSTEAEIDAICDGYIKGPTAEPSNILLRSNNKTFNQTITNEGVLVIAEIQEV
jgi:hypothetical protein